MKVAVFSLGSLHSNLSQSCSHLVQTGMTRIARRFRRSAPPIALSQIILQYRRHTWSSLLCALRISASCCRRTNQASDGGCRDSRRARQSEIYGPNYDRAKRTLAIVRGVSTDTHIMFAARNETRATTKLNWNVLRGEHKKESRRHS